MARQGRGKKQDKLGTGKVTPMQIAFIVDRYLSENNYTTALSSFRSEASDLLSRTHGKDVPKGLMGLADILEDYIRLKEQRLLMDREKQKIESALKGIHDVIRIYHSDTAETVSVPIATSPQQIMASPTVPFFCGSNPINKMMHLPSISSISKPHLLPPKAADVRFSTPTCTQSSTDKRKTSKSIIAKEPPSPKKQRTQSPTLSTTTQGVGLTSHENSTSYIDNGSNKGKRPVVVDSTIHSSVQGKSVVKKLFRHSECSQPNTSSPKTPPQALASQMDKSLSPLENSAKNATNTTTTTDTNNNNSFPNVVTSSSSCSLISSETIIISPLKHKGYYAVERSYQVTCSPIKTCATAKLGIREHVKGRLDFDKCEAFQSMEKPFAADNSTNSSPSDVETYVGLDFDLPDFEIFDGDFISGLFVDNDDQNEGFSAGSHTLNNSIHGEGPEECGFSQNLTNYSISAAAGASSECIGLQGSSDGVTSVKKSSSCSKNISPASKKGSRSIVEED